MILVEYKKEYINLNERYRILILVSNLSLITTAASEQYLTYRPIKEHCETALKVGIFPDGHMIRSDFFV